MAHHPHPFFRPERNTWFVSLGNHHHNLGKHPDHLPPPEKRNGKWEPPPSVLAAYHAVMAGHASGKEPPLLNGSSDPLVCVVLDEYLEWLKKRVQEGTKAQQTYGCYQDYLAGFLRSLPDPPGS